MNETEYATTMARAEPVSGYAEPPVQPDGEDWHMVGSTTTPDIHMPGRFYLLWFWTRRVKRLPCPKCNGIARVDGKCLGCGLVIR